MARLPKYFLVMVGIKGGDAAFKQGIVMNIIKGALKPIYFSIKTRKAKRQSVTTESNFSFRTSNSYLNCLDASDMRGTVPACTHGLDCFVLLGSLKASLLHFV